MPTQMIEANCRNFNGLGRNCGQKSSLAEHFYKNAFKRNNIFGLVFTNYLPARPQRPTSLNRGVGRPLSVRLLIVEHVFWLEEGALCGRPGPNHVAWQPASFLEAGIGGVLSVTNAESVDTDELRRHGLDHVCVPLAGHAPPEPGELELCLERLPKALDFVNDHNSQGSAVLVHCRHGKDRTGLFMAYFLMQRHGLSVDEAVARVKDVRSIAMTAEGWDEFVPDVLRAVLRG